ncbi:hypothetical protein [Neobacillus niacini]|uniref:hypothetical protein n=1 Tax=Neobacillus niacini TaxID=86668 RepID=UPI0005EE7574|nr:hypothetical protein [Neobacillus niacini]
MIKSRNRIARNNIKETAQECCTALKAAGGAGYPYSIQWTIDTIDWQQPSVEVIVSRIQSGASNGDIILMHIGGINTSEVVDRVIPILKGMGFNLVTLTELLDL